MNAKDSILKNLLKEDTNEEILFEQYKLYVEMANEISNRRDNANKFYLTLISLFITIFSIINSITHDSSIFIIPLIIIIIICCIWAKTIDSYSTLNIGKFNIINEIEKKLPAKGFTIEWELLIKVYSYNKLTIVEKWVPKIIGIIAVIAIIFLLIIQKGYCIF